MGKDVIDSGPKYDLIIIGLGGNDLATQSGIIKPEYPAKVSDDVADLCDLIGVKSEAALFIFGGPSKIWNYPPKWDEYIATVHGVIEEEEKHCVTAEELRATMTKLQMANDGLHFADTDNN